MKTKILCILDGFGLGPDSINNVISRAKIPNLRRVMSQYFWTTLDADGESVGQEAGLVGNSEVGHINIGGLQLVPQLSYQITKSAANGFKEFQKDQLINPTEFVSNNSQSKTIHLIGLFSTGTIHSDLRHWIGAIESAGQSGATKIVLHLFSDGRDSDKKSLVATWQYFITEFKDRLQPFEDRIFLGSLGGRFYGMDRDNNLDRTIDGLEVIFQPNGIFYHLGGIESSHGKLCKYFLNKRATEIKYGKLAFGGDDETVIEYNPKYVDEFYSKHVIDYDKFLNELVYYEGCNLEQIQNTLKKVTELNYKNNIFDEHIFPISFDSSGFREYDAPFSILPNDTLWLINFRSDRMKQTTQIICQLNQEFELNLNILAINDYGIDSKYKYTPIFNSQKVQNTLAQTISKSKQTQLHIAETEKYAHVTYFLNGGSTEKNIGEDWELIPSNKVNSHSEKPEMKAKEITEYIIDHGIDKYDYIIVNYANPDMLAHTGRIPESLESLEFLDEQLGRLIETVEQGGHSLIITADHGNCEFVGEFVRKTFLFSQELNKQIEIEQNLTDTEHNPNPVPCIIVDTRFSKAKTSLPKDQDQNNFGDIDLDKIKNLGLKFDQNQIQKILYHCNYNLIGEQNWLTQQQINDLKQDQLPLWYVGLLLLCL